MLPQEQQSDPFDWLKLRLQKRLVRGESFYYYAAARYIEMVQSIILPTSVSQGENGSISAATKLQVKLHPVVIFQILDAFLRRDSSQEQVVGSLLGVVDATTSTVEITHSFTVPHDESSINLGFHKQMMVLQQQAMTSGSSSSTVSSSTAAAQQSAVLVGWFSTDSDVSHNVLIHKMYERECQNPIHLTIDPLSSLRSASNDVNIQAFVSRELSAASVAADNQFTPVAVVVKSTESEALDMMKTPDDSTTSTSLKKSIKKLYNLICDSDKYVDSVISGKVVGKDASIGREFATALMAIPTLDKSTVDRVFNSSVEDLLMINHLASITQSQVAISERLLNSL